MNFGNCTQLCHLHCNHNIKQLHHSHKVLLYPLCNLSFSSLTHGLQATYQSAFFSVTLPFLQCHINVIM